MTDTQVVKSTVEALLVYAEMNYSVEPSCSYPTITVPVIKKEVIETKPHIEDLPLSADKDNFMKPGCSSPTSNYCEPETEMVEIKPHVGSLTNNLIDSIEPSGTIPTISSDLVSAQPVIESKPLAMQSSPQETVPDDPFNVVKGATISDDFEEEPLIIVEPVESKPLPMQTQPVETKPATILEAELKPVAVHVVESKPLPIKTPVLEDHKAVMNSLLTAVIENMDKKEQSRSVSPNSEYEVVKFESKPLEPVMGPLAYFTSGLKKTISSPLKTPGSSRRKRSVTFKYIDENSNPLASFVPAKAISVKQEPMEVDHDTVQKIKAKPGRKRKTATEPTTSEDKENETGVTPKRTRRPSAIKRELMEVKPVTPKTPNRTPRSTRKAPAAQKNSSDKKNQKITTPKAQRTAPKKNSAYSTILIDAFSVAESEDSTSCDDSEEEFVIIDERRGHKRNVFRTRNNNMESDSDDDASSVRAQPSPVKKYRSPKVSVKKEPKTPKTPMTPKQTPRSSSRKTRTIKDVLDESSGYSSLLGTPGKVKNFCMECQEFTHKPGEKNQGPRRHILTTHLNVKLYQCAHCDHGSVHDRYHVRLHAERVHKDFSRGSVIYLMDQHEDEVRYWMKKCFDVEGKSARSPDNSKKAIMLSAKRQSREEVPKECKGRRSGEKNVETKPNKSAETPRETQPMVDRSRVALESKPLPREESPLEDIIPDDDDDFDYDALSESPSGPTVMSWTELQKNYIVID